MVQAYLKHCLQYVVEHCREDLEFFAQQNDKTLVQRLQVTPSPQPLVSGPLLSQVVVSSVQGSVCIAIWLCLFSCFHRSV